MYKSSVCHLFNIIIKEGYQCGAVDIMIKDCHGKRIMELLNNTESNQEINTIPAKKVKIHIGNRTEKKTIINFDHNTSKFIDYKRCINRKQSITKNEFKLIANVINGNGMDMCSHDWDNDGNIG